MHYAFIPIPSPPHFNKDFINRGLDIHYRGSSYSPLAGYQREFCSNYISKLTTISHPDGSKSIPHDAYIQEIKTASSILSPFGWGEICTRDFEAFVYGATLLKPSMEHCITFPNVYISNETYIPLDWSFCDIDEILEQINSKRYKEIAKNGQENYSKYIITDKAKEIFVEHIIEILEL